MQEGNMNEKKLDLILLAVRQLAKQQKELKRQVAEMDERLAELNRATANETNSEASGSLENEAQVCLLDGQMMTPETASFQIQKELLELKRRVKKSEWEPFADSV